ncbi:peptidoglycan-N-acetylmuramic acid deacetylase [Bacillus oleivorans]|uniref:Peptidoglycan-N-acetylmuramic acid deacetylase n=2 Tax=Bacillus oleivorans TaxID=1448271 RepID=A0A285CS50_9BACI|nr:peptidoglycan-N-acetylmuramic acid deacetylase [Bacillus oleivorans]
MSLFKKIGVLITAFMLILCQTGYAVSNQSIGWGFKRATNGEPPDAGNKYNELLEKYDAVYKGPGDRKVLYLTFDNGYENGYTEKVLNVLKEEKVPAAFFVTGHYIRTEPDLLKRMVNEGHIVGNHSNSHPDFTQISDEQIRRELKYVKDEVAKITGQQHMNYLRPPRGIFSERSLKVAKEEGYFHIFWSLAFVDWNVNQQRGWRYAYDSIMKQVHPGAIILLHTVSKDNAEALQKVLRDLKKQGYTFKSLDDLYMNSPL